MGECASTHIRERKKKGMGVGGEERERRSSWRKRSRGRKEREKEWMRGGTGRRAGVEGETAVGGGVEKTCFCSHLCCFTQQTPQGACHVKTQRTEPSVKEFRGHLDKLNNNLAGWTLGAGRGSRRSCKPLASMITGMRRMPLFLLREIS